MTKTELQQKLEQTEKLLAELKAELAKKEEQKEWPQKNDEYIFIHEHGYIGQSTYLSSDFFDNNRKNNHNIFKPSDRAFVERLAKKQAFQRLLEKPRMS